MKPKRYLKWHPQETPNETLKKPQQFQNETLKKL